MRKREFRVNRNGVIFHESAVVDVGGLLATTVDISNQDFLAGRYRFNQNVNPDGRVVNEGTISAAKNSSMLYRACWFPGSDSSALRRCASALSSSGAV